MGRTNRIADIFKLGSIDKVRMRVKAKGSRGGLAGSVVYCFSDGIFFLNCIQKRLRIKKFGLFQRTSFMDSTLAKNSHTKIFAISQLPVLIQ